MLPLSTNAQRLFLGDAIPEKVETQTHTTTNSPLRLSGCFACPRRTLFLSLQNRIRVPAAVPSEFLPT